MASFLTEQERAAIAAFPEERVQKIPTGKSGLYDEFGNPVLSNSLNRSTIIRLGTIKRLLAKDVPMAEVAKRMHMTEIALAEMVRRWGLG